MRFVIISTWAFSRSLAVNLALMMSLLVDWTKLPLGRRDVELRLSTILKTTYRVST